MLSLDPGRIYLAVDASPLFRDRLVQEPATALVHHSADVPEAALINRVMGLTRCGVAVVLLFKRECEGSQFWLARKRVRELPEAFA